MRMTCVLFISGILLTGADAVRSVKQLQPAIERNDYGKGSKTEVLDVKVGNTKKKIRTDIEVSERRYTTEEIQELFGRIIRRMDRLILNENQTPDHVETDLNLITEIPGEPVTVSWELDRYDVMNVKGEIQEKNIAEKGTLVKLNAVLTYTENEKEQAAYQCVVCVYPKKLSGEEEIKKTVTENMKKADEKQREQETLILPERLGKNELRYYHPLSLQKYRRYSTERKSTFAYVCERENDNIDKPYYGMEVELEEGALGSVGIPLCMKVSTKLNGKSIDFLDVRIYAVRQGKIETSERLKKGIKIEKPIEDGKEFLIRILLECNNQMQNILLESRIYLSFKLTLTDDREKKYNKYIFLTVQNNAMGESNILSISSKNSWISYIGKMIKQHYRVTQ